MVMYLNEIKGIYRKELLEVQRWRCVRASDFGLPGWMQDEGFYLLSID